MTEAIDNIMINPDKQHILLVDDDIDLLEMTSIFLQSLGYIVDAYTNPKHALVAAQTMPFNLVISDLRMAPMDGMELLQEILKVNSQLPIIIMTAHGSVPSAVIAMQTGAFQYIEKPFSINSLKKVIEDALESTQNFQYTALIREQYTHSNEQGFVFRSPAAKELVTQLQHFSQTDANVFLHGESGSGKEVAARFIHQSSVRASKPFLAINCGAIPENLLESELFGHVKGAFTGATNNHHGLFYHANGGTLLLDEIGDLSLPLQVKLLRVLQEKTIRQVGGREEISIDVRIISATHRDVEQMIKDNFFREDIYYRLHVIPITIPPLRERREDIPLLSQYFLDRITEKLERSIQGFTPAAINKLLTMPWGGNIRELENVIEYAAAATQGQWIDEDVILGGQANSEKEALQPYSEAKAKFEKEYLEYLMTMTLGNVSQASRVAGRYRPDIYKLLKKHNIEPAQYKR